MNSKFDDDKFSMTNVSLLDENISSPRNLTSSPAPLSANIGRSSDRRFSTMNVDELAVAGTSLKSQESTIDFLTKENFNLKLHQYFLIEKLNEISPETCEKLNEENIKLKVGVQSLTTELKKYKNIILELNQAIDILQSKPCPIPHGMNPAEKEEFDKIKNEANASQEENDKLSMMMADLTAENVRLRTTIRTSKTSPTPTPVNPTETDEMIELRKNFRQAKIKIDEQQRAIQILHKNQNNRSSYSNQSEAKSSDRELNAHMKQLESELRMERLQTDRAFGELQDKKTELQNARSDLDHIKKLLHNKTIECNDLREKCEQLHKDSQMSHSDDIQTAELIKAVQELEEDNEELVSVIQSRDQDVAALEAEMEKLLSHLDEKGQDENSKEQEEKLMIMEEAIQEREEEIDILKKELKTVAEAHDEDIEAFEEHMVKAQTEINNQKQLNQEIVEELENTKKYCQDDLTKQYNDMIVSIRERDVRIASLEGNFEQKTDTMQRERDLLVEEIGELKDRLHEVYDELHRHEETIMDMRSMMKNKEEPSFIGSNNSQESIFQKRTKELENKYDTIRQELGYTHEENKNLQIGYRDLKQRFLSIKSKNDLLNKLLDQHKKSAEKNSGHSVTDKTSLLSRLNNELRRDLEEKDRELNEEKQRGDNFEDAYLQVQNNNSQLQKQLDRRDSMLTNSLIAHDKLKDEGDFMTNILYEQATGGGHPSFRRTPDYAMSSF